jgi:bacteriocin-like protein
MTRETTMRTLSAKELESVIGGTRPLIRMPPTDAGGWSREAYREFQSDEAKG